MTTSPENAARFVEMKAVLDLLPTAILLLDRTATVLCINAEATQTLKDRPELGFDAGRVFARRAEEQAALETALESVHATRRDAMMAFRTREGVPEFAIAFNWVAPVSQIMAVMTAVRSDGRAHASALTAILRLTGAEIRLAERLQAGETLAEAAESTGISIATARSALRSILAKSGSRSQAALAAVLSRLAKLKRPGR